MRQPSFSFPTRFSAGYDDAVEEHLGEFIVAGDGLDRPDPDARTVQVDQQETDAGVPRLGLRIRADQREHPVRVMAPGGPDFLPLHHEMVALQRGARRKAGKVGAGAGFGIALSPDHRAGDDWRQMLCLLLVVAELHDDRTNVIEALDRQMRRAEPRQFLDHDDLFVERGAHAAVMLGPMRCDPPFGRK